MATRKPVQPTGTAITNWDEQLAAAAEAAAKMEASAGGGQFFSIKGGILTFNDAPMPGNRVGAVILASVLENVFYDGDYDPDSPQAPICYAFGDDEATMAPHENAPAPQHDQCHGCPQNEFGSAHKGKGKACRNVRRLALIPAGSFVEERFTPFKTAEEFEKAQIGFMKVPVTSVRGFANFVKTVATVMRRPPFAIFTKISVVPDPKSQFRVLFEPIDKVPNSLAGVVTARHEEAVGVINFPYPEVEEVEKPARRVIAKKKPAVKR